MKWFTLLFYFSQRSYANEDLIPDGVNCDGNEFYRKHKKDGRIVGGVEVIPHSWNWIAYVLIDGQMCGGSILTDRWIVTAAHCIFPRIEDREGATVTINKHRLSGDGDNYKILDYYIHPDYDKIDVNNDIALLRVERMVLNSQTTNVVCLPPRNSKLDDGKDDVGLNDDNDDGNADFEKDCFAGGWGTTWSGGRVPDKLQSVKVNIFADEYCRSYEHYGDEFYGGVEICAGTTTGGKDSCQGDSGGPLVCIKNNKPVLVGVVSWGYGCAEKDFPGIYTQLNVFMDWMHSVIDAKVRKAGANVRLSNGEGKKRLTRPPVLYGLEALNYENAEMWCKRNHKMLPKVADSKLNEFAASIGSTWLDINVNSIFDESEEYGNWKRDLKAYLMEDGEWHVSNADEKRKFWCVERTPKTCSDMFLNQPELNLANWEISPREHKRFQPLTSEGLNDVDFGTKFRWNCPLRKKTLSFICLRNDDRVDRYLGRCRNSKCKKFSRKVINPKDYNFSCGGQSPVPQTELHHDNGRLCFGGHVGSCF